MTTTKPGSNAECIERAEAYADSLCISRDAKWRDIYTAKLNDLVDSTFDRREVLRAEVAKQRETMAGVRASYEPSLRENEARMDEVEAWLRGERELPQWADEWFDRLRRRAIDEGMRAIPEPVELTVPEEQHAAAPTEAERKAAVLKFATAARALMTRWRELTEQSLIASDQRLAELQTWARGEHALPAWAVRHAARQASAYVRRDEDLNAFIAKRLPPVVACDDDEDIYGLVPIEMSVGEATMYATLAERDGIFSNEPMKLKDFTGGDNLPCADVEDELEEVLQAAVRTALVAEVGKELGLDDESLRRLADTISVAARCGGECGRPMIIKMARVLAL